MDNRVATGALVAGYCLAVPFTLWVPGFRRMWSRPDPSLFIVEEVGAALITAGWAAKGNTAAVAVNATWLLGFGATYLARAYRRR